jgi:hypothetical protein
MMAISLEKYDAPGTTRTCDPLIRSQVLYPTELRVRFMVKAEERIYVGHT